MSHTMQKPRNIGVVLTDQEIVELKMIVQDDDEPAALDFARRLKRKVTEVEQRHCGDPDRLPGLD